MKIYKDWNNKEECVEHLENELKYAYKNGFTLELTSSMSDDSKYLDFNIEDKSKDKFHNFTNHLVDQYSMNQKGKSHNA